MTQVSKVKLSSAVEKAIFEIFISALINTKNTKQARSFINDFFTPTEKIMLAKRFAIAFLLYKGLKAREICEILKVSIATVSRVNTWFKYGGEGYRDLIKRISLQREMRKLLVDLWKSYKYDTLLPPRGRNWKDWAKEKGEWERERKNPLR